MSEAATSSGPWPGGGEGPLGIIGGSHLVEGPLPFDAHPLVVPTLRGEVSLLRGDGFVFLRRHGHGGDHPPHRIPHHAHALALEALGVRRVVAFCSVGGLRPDLIPGTVLVPDDYLSLHPPPTFAEDERLHVVPALDPALRQMLVEAARDALAGGGEPISVGGGRPGGGGAEGQGMGPQVGDGDGGAPKERASVPLPARTPAGGSAGSPDVRDGGVYAETRGPRFETRAEIRMLAAFADVVGMTGASEATLLQERGIASAILAIVDNLAHGVGTEPLTLEGWERQAARNGALARRILGGVLARWTGGGDGGSAPRSPGPGGPAAFRSAS